MSAAQVVTGLAAFACLATPADYSTVHRSTSRSHSHVKTITATSRTDQNQKPSVPNRSPAHIDCCLHSRKFTTGMRSRPAALPCAPSHVQSVCVCSSHLATVVGCAGSVPHLLPGDCAADAAGGGPQSPAHDPRGRQASRAHPTLPSAASQPMTGGGPSHQLDAGGICLGWIVVASEHCAVLQGE